MERIEILAQFLAFLFAFENSLKACRHFGFMTYGFFDNIAEFCGMSRFEENSGLAVFNQSLQRAISTGSVRVGYVIVVFVNVSDGFLNLLVAHFEARNLSANGFVVFVV